MRFETRAIHVGQEPDPATGSVVVPIYATTTFAQERPGSHRGYAYARTANPTRSALESALASLENAATSGGAVATASGMAATALVGYLLSPGDHVVLPGDVYGGTYRFFAGVLTEMGVDFTAADLSDRHELAAAIRPGTSLIWVETPTNPNLTIIDLEWVVAAAHEAGALVCVDNTFATPYLQQPLDFGADLVMHSTTKYLGGHSDVVGGALVTSDPDLLARLRFLQNAAGPVPGPFDAYLVLRGVKTLALRMQRHCANAAAIARFLDADSRVGAVSYPGLAGHPQHELATRQMSDYGGMVSFRAGSASRAEAIASATELFFLAESLGGVESLIEVPAAMTHQSVTGTALEVPADLVRLSVGIEHVDDLIADLDRALG